MYADVTATAEFTGHGSLTVFAVFNLQMSIIMISITFFFYLNITVYSTKAVKIGELKHMQQILIPVVVLSNKAAISRDIHKMPFAVCAVMNQSWQ